MSYLSSKSKIESNEIRTSFGFQAFRIIILVKWQRSLLLFFTRPNSKIEDSPFLEFLVTVGLLFGCTSLADLLSNCTHFLVV